MLLQRMLMALTILMIGTPAFAQRSEKIEPLPITQDEREILPSVVVTATRSERRAVDVAAAIDAVDIDNITQPKLGVNLSEVLDGVPGV
ncbi:MAG: hypothetical protein ABIP56_07505, partial [Dokdonella sp.]